MKSRIISLKIILVLTGALMLGACTTRMTEFNLISTKNIDFARWGEFQRGSQKVQGEDTRYVILLVLPSKLQPSLKNAIEEAIHSVPGCVALTDGLIYQKYYNFLIISFSTYVIEGTPLIDPKLKAQLPSPYIRVTYDENKRKFVPQYLSAQEFERAQAALLSGEVEP